jgi:hypothetical protein
MASSRRTGTNESIDTYHSGGGKDYSSITAWESDTDVNLVSAQISYVLECYAGIHTIGQLQLSAAVTDSSYFRIVRPAAGQGHKGKPTGDGSNVEFQTTYAGNWISNAEGTNGISQIQDCVFKQVFDSNIYKAVLSGGYGSAYVGCICYDYSGNHGKLHAWNAGTSNTPYVCFINCLAINGERAIRLPSNDAIRCYNCTAENMSQVAVEVTSGSTLISKNCIYEDESITGTHTKTTCIVSSPTGVTYRDSGNDDYHLDYTDTTAKGQGTDLSADADYAFDDDINQGVMGAKKAGQTRGTSGKTWDIGFDEYMIDSSFNGVETPYKLNGVHAEDIAKINGVGN